MSIFMLLFIMIFKEFLDTRSEDGQAAIKYKAFGRKQRLDDKFQRSLVLLRAN